MQASGTEEATGKSLCIWAQTIFSLMLSLGPGKEEAVPQCIDKAAYPQVTDDCALQWKLTVNGIKS